MMCGLNIQGLSETFTVSHIRQEDIPRVFSLCSGNPAYYRHCPPQVTEDSIRDDLVALPPGTKAGNKHYLGFWKGWTLIAVMDLIAGFPHENAAFIGFFMVDKAWQRQGTGTRIMEETARFLKPHYQSLHLGYAQGNTQAERFWQNNHFNPTGVITKTQSYTVVSMQRSL
jgi:GNAT superfamily N-acetyltransferase